MEPCEMHFVALGSNIVIVNSPRGSRGEARTLVYDTGEAALAISPPLPGHLYSGLLVAVPDTLYALTTFGYDLPLSFEALSWAPCTRDTDEPGPRTHEWSWKTVPAPPPPFGKEKSIVSYAVPPDGRTIFVSTRDAAYPHRDSCTYSFDTKPGEWRWLGAWVLPFYGQGYFDSELDAWVGLHKKHGYICVCQVTSRSGMSIAPPESDTLEEKLYGKGAEHLPAYASLTYTGDGNFYLVESAAPGNLELGYACHGYVVHVTMFGLKFNRKGQLQTRNQRTINSYVAPKNVASFAPVAFWMLRAVKFFLPCEL